MPVAEEMRKVVAPDLEVYGLGHDPESFRAWRETNDLQRCLAHSLALDGEQSRPLRSTAQGEPGTVPLMGSRRPTGQGSVLVVYGEGTSLAFETAKPRMVKIEVTEAVVRVEDGCLTGLYRGLVTPEAALFCYIEQKDMELTNLGATHATAYLTWWDL